MYKTIGCKIDRIKDLIFIISYRIFLVVEHNHNPVQLDKIYTFIDHIYSKSKEASFILYILINATINIIAMAMKKITATLYIEEFPIITLTIIGIINVVFYYITLVINNNTHNIKLSRVLLLFFMPFIFNYIGCLLMPFVGLSIENKLNLNITHIHKAPIGAASITQDSIANGNVSEGFLKNITEKMMFFKTTITSLGLVIVSYDLRNVNVMDFGYILGPHPEYKTLTLPRFIDRINVEKRDMYRLSATFNNRLNILNTRDNDEIGLRNLHRAIAEGCGESKASFDRIVELCNQAVRNGHGEELNHSVILSTTVMVRFSKA